MAEGGNVTTAGERCNDKQSPTVHVFIELTDHKIHGAPVVEDGKVVNLIDFSHFAAYALEWWEDSNKMYEDGNEDVPKISQPEPTISTLLGKMPTRHRLTLVTRATKISEIIAKLAGTTHRVVVVDEKTGAINSVVSQRDFLKLLDTKFKHEMPRKTDGSEFCAADILKTPCISVLSTGTMANAISEIVSSKVNGIAIVEEEGDTLRVVSNVSVSDLQYFVRASLDNLDIPIPDFLQKRKEQGCPDLISCDPSSPLSKIITILTKNGIHRIYVTNEKRELLGLITASDIFKLFRSEGNTKQ